MNRYFLASGGLHVVGALLLILLLAPSAKKVQATYTIDFIGSGKVQAVTGQESSKGSSQAVKTTVQAPQPAQEATVKEPPKSSKKAYAAKTEISAKPNPKNKEQKEVPLAAPSILEESSSENTAAGASKEGEFEGGNIQTDFANFPYPWYITQVRNSLWIEWEKRRPVGSTLAALVTFSIARDGKIKNLKVEKSSGDDSYDFAATSAVINAGPFQALPMYYEKDELSVTVEFKQEK
ncbi:MAG: TonB C-terminal domain-containing protein [Elusimicrobiaceae bacterium]|nr:TonB C-terminal domain-containing protein [Elusimicrobiaceae bacterium]